MFEIVGGSAILYLMLCLIPPVIATAVGAPFPKLLALWMLLTGWTIPDT